MFEGISDFFSGGLFGGLFKGGVGEDGEGIGGTKAGLFSRASGAKDEIHQGRGGGAVESFLDDEE